MKHSSMRGCLVLLVSLFFLAGFRAEAIAEGEWTGNINVLAGIKDLDEDIWAPADLHAEAGVEIDMRKQGWPVNIALDILHSSGDGRRRRIEFEGETTELNLGVRKIIEEFSVVRPFLGAGVSFISGEFSDPRRSDDDRGVGFWVGGGVYWTIGRRLNIGFELKFSGAEITLFDTDGEAGGAHFGVLAGHHW